MKDDVPPPDGRSGSAPEPSAEDPLDPHDPASPEAGPDSGPVDPGPSASLSPDSDPPDSDPPTAHSGAAGSSDAGAPEAEPASDDDSGSDKPSDEESDGASHEESDDGPEAARPADADPPAAESDADAEPPDATLGGYLEVHTRPPAFDGVDGQPYSVSIEVERVGSLVAPFVGYLVYPRWAETGVGIVGHVETPILWEGRSREEILEDAGALPLSDVKRLLDEAIRRREEIEGSQEGGESEESEESEGA